jgi:multiple sugar transport system ATP-binding protein
MIKTPKLFLFDEPLSNLDAKLRNHMRTEIAELHRSLGATSIYVTHDQLEAMTLADRIVLMRGGTIEQIATPHEIYRHPASQFAADFIGNPGMNFLDAGVRRSQDEWSLVLGELSVGLSGRLFHLQENDSVILGIRPQDVIVGESTSHGLGPFTGVVNAVEFHGHDSLVSISLNETKFSALMPAKKAAHKGETISCSIAEEDIHLFSKQTGNSLRRPPKNA